MKTNIFIPEKINVGFQSREDTYTKKLAYVIYFDQKGILRKEASWNSWRDKKIDNIIYDNIPTSGFVLNKKAGGYSTGWNHRQTYCRVYDSRDFEFEITIPNLLYILENTNSIKGKGLEGLFVYGWDGTDLVLIPVDSHDYKEISQFNEVLHANNYIKSKDLIIGATYRTKDNNEYIYMGRFDYWDTKYEYGTNRYGNKDYSNYVIKDINKGKHYYFILNRDEFDSYNMLKIKSLGDKFIECISSECIGNYADLFDKLECTTSYSPYDKNKDEYINYTYEEFLNKTTNNRRVYCFNNSKNKYEVYRGHDELFWYKKETNDYWSEKAIQCSIDEIFNILQPMYKNEYLSNGKLYRKGNE